MKFYPNQNVRIVTKDGIPTVTTQQTSSTPGIYTLFYAFKNTNYLIKINCTIRRVSGNIICWTCENRKIKNKYSTTSVIDKDKFDGEDFVIPYYNPFRTGYVKIGILFSGCTKDDNFTLNKITFQKCLNILNFGNKKIYTIFNAVKNRNYNITIDCNIRKVSGEILVWTCENRIGSNLFQTITYLDKENINNSLVVPYYHSAKSGKIRIGIILTNYDKGDGIIIRNIKFHKAGSIFPKDKVPKITLEDKVPKITLEDKITNRTELEDESIHVELEIQRIKKKDNIQRLFLSNSGIANKILRSRRTLEWEETDPTKKKKVILTVGLPARKADRVIWLALESLKNQENIDFGWELICWEDVSHSKDIIQGFIGKLPGCQRIIYRWNDTNIFGYKNGNMKGRILLIDKWIGMASEASITSEIFVLHACDCYSPPRRLWIHTQHFKNKNCYFSTQPRGLFYNLITKEMMFYAPYESPTANSKKNSVTHLNMALRTNDLRIMKPLLRNSSIDTYILNHIQKLRKIKNISSHIFQDFSIDTNNWMYGIDTDGANSISLKRRRYYKNPYEHSSHFFLPYNQKIKNKMKYINPENYLPSNVISFLINFNRLPT